MSKQREEEIERFVQIIMRRLIEDPSREPLLHKYLTEWAKYLAEHRPTLDNVLHSS